MRINQLLVVLFEGSEVTVWHDAESTKNGPPVKENLSGNYLKNIYYKVYYKSLKFDSL